MALGLTYSQNIPNQIRDSARFMSDNLRQIGQQVQGHIVEHQTRKDLGAMAQEIQAMNVRSNDFPIQLIQTASRHPLALRDERGQMAIQVLGKAHNQWQSEQAAISRFNPYRSMTGGGIYNANTGEVTTEPTAKPTAVNRNSRLVDPVTGDVIVEPEELPEKGFNLAPGATRYDAQGNHIVTAPRPTGSAALTENQRRNLALRETALRRAAINEQVSSAERDIRALEQSLRSGKESSPAEKLEWQKQVEALRDQRNRLLQDLNAPPTAEELPVEPELGAVPMGVVTPQGDGGVLPAPGVVAAPLPDGGELVAVINPQGKPTRIRKSQLESALQNGYKPR